MWLAKNKKKVVHRYQVHRSTSRSRSTIKCILNRFYKVSFIARDPYHFYLVLGLCYSATGFSFALSLSLLSLDRRETTPE